MQVLSGISSHSLSEGHSTELRTTTRKRVLFRLRADPEHYLGFKVTLVRDADNQSFDAAIKRQIATVRHGVGNEIFANVLPPIWDAKRTAILGDIRDLVRKLNAAGAGAIGFIYYFGHGAAEKDTNINYLIPVDAKEPGSTAFWDESVKLDDVLRLLDGARAAAKFIVFDACRNELQLPPRTPARGWCPSPSSKACSSPTPVHQGARHQTKEIICMNL
jgi:Caspase domain